MFGFNPGWFIGMAIGVVGVTETFFPERFRPTVRKIAFPLSAVLLVLGLVGFGVDFHEQYELRWPIASRSELSGSQETSGWPLPSKPEISDLADNLRAYQPDYAVIIYDDAQEEALALDFAKAMHLANWRQPSMVGQLESPRLGIEIFVGSEVTGVLEPLKKFCRKQLKTEPTIATTPQAGLSTKSIQITIGHNEAD